MRSERVNVRVRIACADEKTRVTLAAKAARLSVSNYFRTLAGLAPLSMGRPKTSRGPTGSV